MHECKTGLNYKKFVRRFRFKIGYLTANNGQMSYNNKKPNISVLNYVKTAKALVRYHEATLMSCHTRLSYMIAKAYMIR